MLSILRLIDAAAGNRQSAQEELAISNMTRHEDYDYAYSIVFAVCAYVQLSVDSLLNNEPTKCFALCPSSFSAATSRL